MHRQRIIFTGTWWRFNNYELQGGHIVPSTHARLERYDPWTAFENIKSQSGQAPGAQPGYQSLIKLVQGFEFHPVRRRYPRCLTDQTLERILRWCQEHGPLGILLSQWESIRLAAQESWQFQYSRGFGQVIHRLKKDSVRVPDPPRVVLHRLNDLGLKEEPPSRTWAGFFPSVSVHERDSFVYPEPYSDEFCWLYAESVMEFCNAAGLLSGAALYLRPSATEDQLARAQALDTINTLRRPVSSLLDLDPDGNAVARFEAPSLIASFAEMLVKDLGYGRTLLQCACGTPFVSSAYQAAYCSEACRLRYQKRRLRAQMKEARALRSQGQTAKQIAATLGQDRQIVSRWLSKTTKRPGRSPREDLRD